MLVVNRMRNHGAPCHVRRRYQKEHPERRTDPMYLVDPGEEARDKEGGKDSGNRVGGRRPPRNRLHP